MIRFNDIIDKILAYNPDADLEAVQKAYIFSAKVHQGQVRLSGEPYLNHPLEVANILADLRLDVQSIVTGLLHDVVEDTHANLTDIQENFGDKIAHLVDGVTKISQITFTSSLEKQSENFRKVVLAMAKDIRVIFVKLADRLHNMRTLNFLPEKKQVLIAQETRDIYAPLANRLGIGWVKDELEDLSLVYLYPEIYKDIANKIAMKKEEREEYIAEVIKIIDGKLKEFNIGCKVRGRPKHFNSIYQKMVAQNISFEQVYDLLAFRVIVRSLKECYETLGIIHSLWKPVPGRFKDYIAMPKANMYQSLHTTVIGPYGERIEIQIRTEDMHKIAESGIAAHWIYKDKSVARDDTVRFGWVRQLMEWQQDLKDPAEFLETVKIDLFPNEVYVFTPKGDVKSLPREATPVDFAYSIHTDVGNRCVGAKVNGKIVPLKYQLKNGDIIEIITNPKQHPSKDWLKFVKTPRAITRIRQWVKNEERKRGIDIGKEILEKEFKKHSLNFSRFLKEADLKTFLKECGFSSLDDIFAAIAYGKLSPFSVALKLFPSEKLKDEALKEKPHITSKKKSVDSSIIVKDVEDVMVIFAKCCTPLPGDTVTGFITRGRGVAIHKSDCPNVLDSDPQRRIDVRWDAKIKGTRSVKIRVVCVDKKGLLADISSTISSAEVNISNASIKTTEDKKAINVFEVGVNDLDQLNKVIKSIEKIDGVLKVERL